MFDFVKWRIRSANLLDQAIARAFTLVRLTTALVGLLLLVTLAIFEGCSRWAKQALGGRHRPLY